jgi:hypothetical protein
MAHRHTVYVVAATGAANQGIGDASVPCLPAYCCARPCGCRRGCGHGLAQSVGVRWCVGVGVDVGVGLREGVGVGVSVQMSVQVSAQPALPASGPDVMARILVPYSSFGGTRLGVGGEPTGPCRSGFTDRDRLMRMQWGSNPTAVGRECQLCRNSTLRPHMPP